MATPLCRALRRTCPIKLRGSFTVNTAFCSGMGIGAVACLLGELDIAMRLTLGNPMGANKPPDRLRRRQLLLQKFEGLVHTPRVLGRGSSIQCDT
jgi:hypothetical protein